MKTERIYLLTGMSKIHLPIVQCAETMEVQTYHSMSTIFAVGGIRHQPQSCECVILTYLDRIWRVTGCNMSSEVLGYSWWVLMTVWTVAWRLSSLVLQVSSTRQELQHTKLGNIWGTLLTTHDSRKWSALRINPVVPVYKNDLGRETDETCGVAIQQ